MEGRRHLALVVAALLSVAIAEPVSAFQRARSETNDDGVEVVITVGEDGAEHASAGSASGGGSCDWSVVQYPFTGSDPPAQYGEPPSPEHRLYLVFCDGEFVVAQWLGPSGAAALIVDTTALARTVVDQVPVDLATIGVRPEGRGVTGIASYFWVEGYTGEPITGTVDNGPVTVAVSITLGTVTWDFGDGTPPVTAGLGEAWPERSSVRHNYRDRGDRTVTVTVVLPAEFSVNGGAVQQLPPVVRTATIPYVVEEIQAVRNR